jgi:hypothetical protein
MALHSKRCYMLSIIMLSVPYKAFMVSAVMLNVIILTFVMLMMSILAPPPPLSLCQKYCYFLLN